MLENVAKITRVVLACGTVDLRKGIDGLSNYLMLGLNPLDPKIKDVTPQKPF